MARWLVLASADSLLNAAGHEVHAPTLTGLGDRAHLTPPDAALTTHIEDVVALLEMGDLCDVVLVGHSAGGAVITGVAQRAAGRLAGLVYLDAFVPRPEQSVLDLVTPEWRERFLAAVDETGCIALDWDAALDGWGVPDARDRAWVRPRLRPHPLGGLSDRLPSPAVPDLPRHYVHCTDKPARYSFEGFAAAARDDPSWRLHELHTGHDAMITAPRRLAEVLLDAGYAMTSG